METSSGLELGNIYKQCSLSRSAAITVAVTEIRNGDCVTSAQNNTPVGSLDWEGDPSVLRTFHGARISKNGRTVNECVSASFDLRNMMCLGCKKTHHILNPVKPSVLIFADQNFTPFLSGDENNCVAVCRLENATLSELADLAMEVIDKTCLPPGTTLLFGSGSHLYRVGTAQYATDWITIVNRCSQKWPSVNTCPLIPIFRTDCPGNLARDISTLSSWLGRVYANSTTGLLDTWKMLLQTTEEQCMGTESPEICKIPLPTSISVGSVQSHAFIYYSSCPAVLKGTDRKATAELLRKLIETLNRDFSANLNPDLILAENWAGVGDTTDPVLNAGNKLQNNRKHIVLIGASNMKRLVPIFSAAGYHVTDLSRPSWMATAENIEYIAEQLNSLALEPGYIAVMELFGNSTFRYRQFDGTMALPFKSNKQYHMEGKIGVCDPETIIRLISSMQDLILSVDAGTKIFVPPLPRYLYKGCCSQKTHSTNTEEEGYALNLLNDTMRLRSVIKTDLLSRGMENFFVLDGVGALLGVTPGCNRGPASESLADLDKIMADDNVHFSELGYKNLGTTILQAIDGIKDGSLTKTVQSQQSASAGAGSAPAGKCNYFWRGFSSPVGISGLKTPAQHHHQQQKFGPQPGFGFGSGSGNSSRAHRDHAHQGSFFASRGGGHRGKPHHRGHRGHWGPPAHPYARR
jgi:hypothetical protein